MRNYRVPHLLTEILYFHNLTLHLFICKFKNLVHSFPANFCCTHWRKISRNTIPRPKLEPRHQSSLWRRTCEGGVKRSSGVVIRTSVGASWKQDGLVSVPGGDGQVFLDVGARRARQHRVVALHHGSPRDPDLVARDSQHWKQKYKFFFFFITSREKNAGRKIMLM